LILQAPLVVIKNQGGVAKVVDMVFRLTSKELTDET
jgi:hypothetical protein